MTISGYSNAIVDVMLGWLKGLANWVLRLFNLAGSVSASPLLWLSRNWLKLLIFFLVLGVVLDRLVWLIRWRPYWVWFRKERVIVNDSRFFVGADMDKAPDWEGDLMGNWDEHDYVVASTVVNRRPRGAKATPAKPARRSDARRGQAAVRRREGTKVERHVDRAGPKPATRDDRALHRRRGSETVSAPDDSIFSMSLKKTPASDSYEDEVFNVSNLPVFDEYGGNERKKPNRRQRQRKPAR